MKTVSSINGWVKRPEGYFLRYSSCAGGFYLMIYERDRERLKVIYNQEGREVFREEWIEPKRKGGTWLNRLRLWWSGRATSAGRS